MNIQTEIKSLLNMEYIKLDRDKSTIKIHRDFDSEIEITFKHFPYLFVTLFLEGIGRK